MEAGYPELSNIGNINNKNTITHCINPAFLTVVFVVKIDAKTFQNIH